MSGWFSEKTHEIIHAIPLPSHADLQVRLHPSGEIEYIQAPYTEQMEKMRRKWGIH